MSEEITKEVEKVEEPKKVKKAKKEFEPKVDLSPETLAKCEKLVGPVKVKIKNLKTGKVIKVPPIDAREWLTTGWGELVD